MRIRSESAAAHEAIQAIHIAAFANPPFSNQTEHRILEGLREAAALTVSLVAELDDQVVGHIAFSLVLVDGEPCAVYALGPVGVLPPLQRCGGRYAAYRIRADCPERTGCIGVRSGGRPGLLRSVRFPFRICLAMEGAPPEVFLCLPVAEPMPRAA